MQVLKTKYKVMLVSWVGVMGCACIMSVCRTVCVLVWPIDLILHS